MAIQPSPDLRLAVVVLRSISPTHLPVLQKTDKISILSPGDKRRLIHPSYLDEADILALLTEALSADVEAVFSDQTGFVGADTAFAWGGK
jgi:hypothetical protein